MILDRAEEKIGYFNKIGIHYEAVYHYVIRKRQQTRPIYTLDFLDDITAGIISFDMQRMMGPKKYFAHGNESWASVLKQVIIPHRSTLESLRSFSLSTAQLSHPGLKSKIILLFDDLSKAYPNGLNFRNRGKSRFPVGASKILHFLIPDLFIIFDSNALRELQKLGVIKRSQKYSGELYHAAMTHYQAELRNWALENKDQNFDNLQEIDPSYKVFGNVRKTPLPRIVDKCTFVGDVFLKIEHHRSLKLSV